MSKKSSLFQQPLFEENLVSATCWRVGIVAQKDTCVDWAEAAAWLIEQLPGTHRFIEFKPLAVCRRERFSPKISPLDGRFRPKSERWSPTFRVEIAVVRASDFLSDKLLGRFFFYLELELDGPPTDEWVEDMGRVAEEVCICDYGEIDRSSGLLLKEIEHPPHHEVAVPQILLDMIEQAIAKGRRKP